MRTARFRVELPPGVWIGAISRAHPEARFRLLAGVETGSGALELGEVRASPVEPAIATFREHPAVSGYEQLFLGDDRGLARYETADAALYRFLRSTGVPPEFPVEVQEGAFEIEATASRDRLHTMQASLEASPLEHEVLFVARARSADQLLTDRQRQVLEVAASAGYFEVPRRATLTELAQRLDVDKSTLSGIVRRAQARLVERFLVDQRLG